MSQEATGQAIIQVLVNAQMGHSHMDFRKDWPLTMPTAAEELLS